MGAPSSLAPVRHHRPMTEAPAQGLDTPRARAAVRAPRGGGCGGRRRRHGARQPEGPRETSRPTAAAALGQRATRVKP